MVKPAETLDAACKHDLAAQGKELERDGPHLAKCSKKRQAHESDSLAATAKGKQRSCHMKSPALLSPGKSRQSQENPRPRARETFTTDFT